MNRPTAHERARAIARDMAGEALRVIALASVVVPVAWGLKAIGGEALLVTAILAAVTLVAWGVVAWVLFCAVRHARAGRRADAALGLAVAVVFGAYIALGAPLP